MSQDYKSVQTLPETNTRSQESRGISSSSHQNSPATELYLALLHCLSSHGRREIFSPWLISPQGTDWKAGPDYNSVPDTPIPGSPMVLVQILFLQMLQRIINQRSHRLSMGSVDGNHLLIPKSVLLVATLPEENSFPAGTDVTAWLL